LRIHNFPVSAGAFNTIDHDILISRLSPYVGTHGSVLNQFKSYLSSRCFRVNCDNQFRSHTNAVFSN